MMSKISPKWILLSGLAVLAIAWWYYTPPSAPVEEWKPAKQDKRLSGTSTKTIKPPGGVVVYDPPAKEKLDLPDEVKKDPKKHVTAAVTVPSDEHPQSVVTIFDESTGQTTALTQRMAFPLLAAEQRGQVWLGYGLRNGARVGRIMLREDLLQVKALHLGLNASLDTDGAWFVGVGVGYRW